MQQPIIRLDNVWKTYRMGSVSVDALRGLTLDIRKGEFVAVQGASGSGKSTAMNIIGCLDYPTKGKVLLEGKDVEGLDESELAQARGRKIGFVFQQFNLMPNLTALENVSLPMVFQGVPKAERLRRSRQLLVQVGLGERLAHLPRELSGGQQQRVSVARALANDPEIILADEPTGNLDSATGKSVMQLLKDLHGHGRTVVLVTHDAQLARSAERAIFIRDGRVAG